MAPEQINARIEEGFKQYDTFVETMQKLVGVGVTQEAEEVTIDIDGFGSLVDQFRGLLADCKQLYAERNAALSGGQDTRRLDALAHVGIEYLISLTSEDDYWLAVGEDGVERARVLKMDRNEDTIRALADAIIAAQPGEERGE